MKNTPVHISHLDGMGNDHLTGGINDTAPAHLCGPECNHFEEDEMISRLDVDNLFGRKKRKEGGSSTGTGSGSRKEKKTARKEKRKSKKVTPEGFKKVRGPKLILLAPFKGPMKKALTEKGIKHSNDLQDIATKFYHYIVRKGSYDFEAGTLEFTDSIDASKTGSKTGSGNLAPVAIGVIIDAVLSFFKGLKDKRDAGGKLSPTEQTLLDGAEKVADQIKEEAKDEGAQRIGYIAIFALAAFLIYKFVLN